jgi:hypothetical protein
MPVSGGSAIAGMYLIITDGDEDGGSHSGSMRPGIMTCLSVLVVKVPNGVQGNESGWDGSNWFRGGKGLKIVSELHQEPKLYLPWLLTRFGKAAFFSGVNDTLTSPEKWLILKNLQLPHPPQRLVLSLLQRHEDFAFEFCFEPGF